MAQRLLQLGLCVLLGAAIMRYFVRLHEEPSPLTSPFANEDLLNHVPLNEELGQKIDTFEIPLEQQKIIKVTDRIHKAIGYSFGQTIILEGDEALVIIDTSSSNEAGSSILQDIRKFTSKPIAAFIYTHYHLDHIQGTEGFIEDKSNPPEIWAHHKLPKSIMEGLIIRPKTSRGAIHQFGIALGKARSWPAITLKVTRPLFPTRLVYEEEEQVIIAGLELTILHVPGESADHIAIWFPAAKALISGDSILEFFPNVYAIRGAPARDSLEWCRSLRRLREFKAEYLIPSHGLVVTGRDTINDLLTAYSAGIQYVHDQTVRLMNQQLHPEEIARLVQLPPTLSSHSYMGQYYGRVDWTSKANYRRYVGWFSGDAVDLRPLTPVERSFRMIKMLGEDRMLTEAEAALNTGNNQWALELSTQVIRVQPDNLRAHRIRLESLRALAAATNSPVVRNFYMTMILDDRGLIDWKKAADPASVVDMIDVGSLLDAMKVQLKAESTHGVNATVYVHFEDSNTSFRLQVLFSVLTVDRIDHKLTSVSETDLVITTTEPVWKKIFSKKLTMAVANDNGDVKISGSLADFRQFWSLFD